MDDIRVTISPSSPRLLDQLRLHMRKNGLAYRTEQTYIHWIKRFIYFHNKQHSKVMGPKQIEDFLADLSNTRYCSINTQRTALNALVYLYKRFMSIDVDNLNYIPAKQFRRLPVVYSREEIAAIVQQLHGVHRLQVELMYGSGLRKAELLSLRVKDIDFSSKNIIVRGGKGNKDRSTLLPERLIPRLHDQIDVVERLHAQDIQDGYGEVYLPDALARKYPSAARETAWQFLFPSNNIGRDPRSGILRRYHMHPSSLAKKLKKAVHAANVKKPARAHSFRHSFATHLLDADLWALTVYHQACEQYPTKGSAFSAINTLTKTAKYL